MTKLLLFFFTLLLCVSSEATNVEAPDLNFKGEFFTLRAFKRWRDFNFMADIMYLKAGERPQEKTYTLGGKYRVHPNLKLGAYLQRASGVWHDEDWINIGTGSWTWADTSGRSENSIIMEASPRFLLSFIPGGQWVFEQRIRFFYNFYNDQRHIRTRSNLTYFWLKNGPFMNFNLSYEWYLPMNYGRETIYETWLYLSALYHFNQTFKVSLTYAVRQQHWNATEDFRARTGRDFSATDTAKLWGLNLILML